MKIEDWDGITSRMSRHNSDQVIYRYKIRSYISLFKDWDLEFRNKKVFVTDVFDEAFYKFNICNFLIDSGASVTGADVSPSIVKRAQMHTTARLVQMDSSNHSSRKRFDLIFSPSTFDHADPEYLHQAIINLGRSLKKDGRLILSVHNMFNMHWHLLSLIDTSGVHWEKFSQAKISKVVEQTGMEIIKTSSIMHFPLIYFAPRICKLAGTDASFLNQFERFRHIPIASKFGLLNVYLLKCKEKD